MKKLTGAEIIIECLKEQGVDTVFGYPGGTILNVYEALYAHRNEIRHILTSHEQGASHAADGYARASGRVGVCFATSGPGSTNLVTGLATAYMDSIPVVAVTCNVNLPLLGKDTFQEVDITGITMPITKHGFIVKDVAYLADTIRRAFEIAKSGRPGPVVVDVTKDVTAAEYDYEPEKPASVRPSLSCTEEELNAAVKMISKAKRPFLYVGGGAILSGASPELKTFIEKVNAPVCDTLMGQGAFDQTHPFYVGMIGMHGTKAANFGVTKSDLLIALGARFSDRVIGNAASFAKGAKILHIDIDAAEINKNIKADLALVGDLRLVLKELNKRLEKLDHGDFIKTVDGLKKKHPRTYDPGILSCPMVIEETDKLTPKDTIIVTDVGQHQMWAAAFYTYRYPRTFLTSGGLGTMGYGLGAALGAKCALPSRTVINITGDGCFRMNMAELATASRAGIPVIDIIINNGVLGMVRQWQTLFYHGHYSATVLDDNVDYCKVAEGLGCTAIRVTEKEELKGAIKEALRITKEEERPVVIEVVVDRDDKVFPMVPAGASLADTFDGTDLK